MNSTSKTVIKVEDLSFTYPGLKTPVLKNVSLELKKNKYICIVGHNGSGKSTLSKLLAGIIFPDKGKIFIQERELLSGNKNDVTSSLGIIFQNPDNQFIGSTVRDDIAFGLENRQIPNDQMEDIIVNAASLCGITGLLDRSPQQLSGGQKQRVAIAGVLALNAEIIIFDEATSMLDPVGKKEVKEQMLSLKEKHNKTIISITHDMSQILDSDYVVALKDGELLLQGTPQKILENMKILEATKLENPFIIKLSKLLRERGVNIPNFLKEDDLVAYLRKLL